MYMYVYVYKFKSHNKDEYQMILRDSKFAHIKELLSMKILVVVIEIWIMWFHPEKLISSTTNDVDTIYATFQ